MTGSTLLNARKLLRGCGVEPGMHVADFGSGMTGHMALPASAMVGDSGKVYAVDILPQVLESLENRFSGAGHLNTNIIWGDFERDGGVGIDAGSLDRIFFMNNFWVVNDFSIVMKEMRRLLAPGGQILVVDWQPNSTGLIGPPAEHRTGVMEAMRHLAGNGWKDLYDFGAGDHHWGIRASA